jgi:hypothetical protein
MLGQFVNITDFWHKKSIKLSDAFEVLITLNNKEEPLVNCTGFTIPKLEYEEETIEYGNVAQVFVTPKYDSCKELTLDFYEYMDDKNNNYSCTLKKVFDYIGYKLNQKFSNGLMTNYGVYNIDKVIPIIQIKVLNNNLWRYKFLYHFENLKIVNYTVYNYDYQNESPCKVTVTLSFETYYRQTIDEPVDYGETTETKKITPQDPIYDPNGKANADTIFVEGDPKAHKEDIENDWKQSTNQSDLDMIKEEQLYDPAYNELMGLDLDSDEVEPELQTEMWKQSANESDLDMIRNPELAELEDLDLEDSSPVSNPPVQETQVASNEHIGQQTGGDKGPQGPTSNPNPTKIDNVKTKENTEPKPELASKPQQKKEEKSEFSKSEIKEMAQRAADFDKKAGVKKGKTGTYYTAGLNAMGLNASDRNEFDAAYKANM